MKSKPALQPRKPIWKTMKQSNPGFSLLGLQWRGSMLNVQRRILGEHLQKGLLELCSSEPSQPTKPSTLSSKNYADQIFFYPIRTWFVYEAAANVYPVTTDTSSTNRAIFAFNPSTGQLFLKSNIHAANTTEEVAALLRSVPDGEYPKRIFVDVRKGMFDDFDNLPKGFPKIVMKGSELKLPFQAFLEIEKFINLMKAKANSTNPPQKVDLFSLNIYDDWLKSSESRIVSYTAFNRIVLILRAFDVNNEHAKMLLQLDGTKTEPGHFWPSFSEVQWVKVEVAMKNLVLSDYATNNKNVDIKALAQSEIRHIIFHGAHS